MDVGEGVGGVGFPLEQWFFDMPFCTRWWTSGVVATSFLVQCGIISPFHLFYSARAVMNKRQYWRLITSFFYFGPPGVDLVFHLFFLQRYARLLEESSGRTPARFSFLLFFAALCLLGLGSVLHLQFLGSSLYNVLVYIWSRRNPEARLSLFGIVTFRAPWLPWALIAISISIHGTVPKDELCGIIIGHIWYYFNDIYPPTHGNSRPLDPPGFWFRMWEPRNETAEIETEDDIAQDLAAAPVRDLNE